MRGRAARPVRPGAGPELSPQRFPDAASDPAEWAEGARFQWLKDRIRLEQHAPLIMYNEAWPFRGAGAAYQTWVLAVELRPDETKKQQPLGNRVVLERIRPLIEQLRLPAEYAGQLGRDRLRRLEIDECVFLPAEGIRRREEAPYHPRAFEEHRARADTTAPSSAPVSEPPVGYTLLEDGEGFRIALPERWTRTTADSSYGIRVVNYHSPDRTHRLQVYQVAEPSPAESFRLFLSGATAKAPGFSELRLQTLDDGTFTGTRLEYLADSIRGEADLGTWHVYDERFVASDGKIYAITVYGPDADGRDDELELLTTALDWFCPPLGTCDAPTPQGSTPGNP